MDIRPTAKGLIVSLMFLMATACSHLQPQPEEPVAQNHFALEEGQRLFQHYCSVCHGSEGRGDGRFFASALSSSPPDFTALEWYSKRSDKDLTAAITGASAIRGQSDLCPHWGKTFASVEVRYLVTYIRKLQQQASSVPSQQEEP
jgi:mono/diheme cytochrome c family protein